MALTNCVSQMLASIARTCDAPITEMDTVI